MVEGAHSLTPDLWLHQESAVLTADTHDIWSFTPEFLLMEGIVPESWLCSRASRAPDEAVIDYGPVNWRMTENQLYISIYPDNPVAGWRSLPDSNLVPDVTRNYLARVPYMPFQRAWFNWNVSVVKTERLDQMVENVLPDGWPEEFEITANQTQPLLQFTRENHLFQISIQNRAMERGGRTFSDSIVFNCFAFTNLDQTLDQAIAELDNWSVRWLTIQRAIQHLMGEMES